MTFPFDIFECNLSRTEGTICELKEKSEVIELLVLNQDTPFKFAPIMQRHFVSVNLTRLEWSRTPQQVESAVHDN